MSGYWWYSIVIGEIRAYFYISDSDGIIRVAFFCAERDVVWVTSDLHSRCHTNPPELWDKVEWNRYAVNEAQNKLFNDRFHNKIKIIPKNIIGKKLIESVDYSQWYEGIPMIDFKI